MSSINTQKIRFIATNLEPTNRHRAFAEFGVALEFIAAGGDGLEQLAAVAKHFMGHTRVLKAARTQPLAFVNQARGTMERSLHFGWTLVADGTTYATDGFRVHWWEHGGIDPREKFTYWDADNKQVSDPRALPATDHAAAIKNVTPKHTMYPMDKVQVSGAFALSGHHDVVSRDATSEAVLLRFPDGATVPVKRTDWEQVMAWQDLSDTKIGKENNPPSTVPGPDFQPKVFVQHNGGVGGFMMSLRYNASHMDGEWLLAEAELK